MYHYEVNPKKQKMSRKFFFCFPLRSGNRVFGIILIICSIAFMLYNIYEAYLTIKDEGSYEEKFVYLETNHDSIYFSIVMIYYSIYVMISSLMLIFASLFTIGVQSLNFKYIKSFFVYCFIHISFTIGLMGWEVLNRDWTMFGILAISDVLLIASLFGVKYVMDAVKSGRVYHTAGDRF